VGQLLATLGLTKSHGRPHVSNDNPFSESQFKTLKYRPEFPERFGSQDDGQGFCRRFFQWYNHEQYHSGIALLTPAMLHHGAAAEVLDRRRKTLDAAYARHPQRFVHRRPAPWPLPEAVWINPPSPPTSGHEKGLPETAGSQKPDAPSAHPRSGYPSPSCVPAELDSVSPDTAMLAEPLSREHPRTPEPCLKQSRGRGGWPPHPNNAAREASPPYTNSDMQLSQAG
jgi:hypothetical protein